MVAENEMPACEHKWTAYDDPGVYRDGLNCQIVEICNLCCARRDIQHKQHVNPLKWYENLFLPILFALAVLNLITITPVLTILLWL